MNAVMNFAIRPWMKLVISLIFFWTAWANACEIKSKSDIISLSGPISHLLKELNLLKKPVLAISEFHGISSDEFSGEILKGGMFLSPQVLKRLNSPIIFFDESLEQRKTVQKLALQGIELATKNLDPFSVYELSKKKMLPFLSNCEKELENLDQKVSSIEDKISKTTKREGYYFFYLGEIYPDKKKPNLIMIDNFVLLLQNLKIIKTYPSTLNYVPWSSKVIEEFNQKKTFSIGTVTSKASKNPQLILKKVSDKEFNFYHPSLLVPGMAQINFLAELVEKLPY